MANSKILTAEQEKTLRQPIEEYVGKIQKEIDELRKDGTAKGIMYQSRIENVKRDKTLSKGEKDSEIASCQKELEQAKAVEAQNKDQIAKLIGKAENYLKNNFDKYYNAVKASCIAEKEQALQEHQQKLAKIEKEHKETLAKTSAQAEVKEENYVYKNRVSNEKIELEKEYQRIKDRKHDAARGNLRAPCSSRACIRRRSSASMPMRSWLIYTNASIPKLLRCGCNFMRSTSAARTSLPIRRSRLWSVSTSCNGSPARNARAIVPCCFCRTALSTSSVPKPYRRRCGTLSSTTGHPCRSRSHALPAVRRSS